MAIGGIAGMTASAAGSGGAVCPSTAAGGAVICSDRILTCRIKSICSPAKGGTGCYRFNYQPGS